MGVTGVADATDRYFQAYAPARPCGPDQGSGIALEDESGSRGGFLRQAGAFSTRLTADLRSDPSLRNLGDTKTGAPQPDEIRTYSICATLEDRRTSPYAVTAQAASLLRVAIVRRPFVTSLSGPRRVRRPAPIRLTVGLDKPATIVAKLHPRFRGRWLPLLGGACSPTRLIPRALRRDIERYRRCTAFDKRPARTVRTDAPAAGETVVDVPTRAGARRLPRGRYRIAVTSENGSGSSEVTRSLRVTVR